MAQNEISKEEILAVYPKVAETMADALGCDVEEVKLDVSLIEGLDAESIDFLDMVFRLERAFKIKIPRGKIVENARPEFRHERTFIDPVNELRVHEFPPWRPAHRASQACLLPCFRDALRTFGSREG